MPGSKMQQADSVRMPIGRATSRLNSIEDGGLQRAAHLRNHVGSAEAAGAVVFLPAEPTYWLTYEPKAG